MKTLRKNMPLMTLCALMVTIPSLGAQQEVAPNRFDGTTTTTQKQKPVKRNYKLKAKRMQRFVTTNATRPAKKDLHAGNSAALQSKVER